MNKNNFWYSNNLFPLLVGMVCAGLVSATGMFINFGVGALNEIYVVEMLKSGMGDGNYAAAAAFAAGFLIARVLEGPLVGLLDIGGALMTGVGIGIPALLLAGGYGNLVTSFHLALITGFIIGIIIGSIIMIIRKFTPEEGFSASGTDIMMGAGNTLGRFLGPLIVLSAIKYGKMTGFGSTFGAALCMAGNKSMVGGAIIGAMLFGAVEIYFFS